MTLRTAIIANTGFDGGGSSKLGYEYDKIGMDVYFRNVVQPNQYRPKQEYKTYDTVEELIQILKNYEKAIFLPLVINKTVLEDSFFLPKLREEIPNLKICFLNCSRSDKYFRKVLECCEHTNFEFDWVYSIAPLTECGYEKYTLFNINAYTFLDKPIYTGEKPIVFTAGRVEGIKGTLRYINSITSDFLNGPFCYIHEGANFTWSKSGNVSCTPQLLSFFNLIDGKKECKELFTFKSYGEEPEKGKLSIYPSYQVDDIFDKWKYYYCGVCCILGSKSKQVTKTTLWSNTSFVECENKKENALLKKQSLIWNEVPEYANIEMIDVGIPVLFSRMYANLLGFNIEPLIYDSFYCIPKLVTNEKIKDYAVLERKWLVDKQQAINENIIKVFSEDI